MEEPRPLGFARGVRPLAPSDLMGSPLAAAGAQSLDLPPDLDLRPTGAGYARGGDAGQAIRAEARPMAFGGRALLAGGALCAGDAAIFLAAWAALIPFGAAEEPLPRVFALTAGVLLALFWSNGLYPGYRMHGYELLRRRAAATLRVGAVVCLGALVGGGSLAAAAAPGAVSRRRARRAAA